MLIQLGVLVYMIDATRFRVNYQGYASRVLFLIAIIIVIAEIGFSVINVVKIWINGLF